MKMMKKVLAITTATTMVLGMSVTTFALPENASGTITINNAGADAKFNTTQIVKADPETETGWYIVDQYFDEFQDTPNAFGKVDEQTILKGMIYEATNGAAGSVIENFDTKYAAALDAIWKTIEAPTADTGSTSPLTVTSAGVYVIRGFETGYNYGTMAAYVAFEPYDPSTGLPTDLDDTSVEAKREPEKTEKSSDDSDKVVEIGRTVTYTVTSTVPYIASTELATAEYWFKDTLTGGEYVKNQEGNVDVSVSIEGVEDPFLYEATPKDATENDVKKETISVNMKNLLANNAYANKTITITYQAVVTDTYTENSASTGKSETDSSFGTSTEKLFTGDVTMTKYAEDGTTKLSGAGFEVRKVVAGEFGYESEPLKFTKVGDGIYKYDPKGTETVTEVFTGSAGTVTLQGLDLGGYEFKETTAPEGYTINEETRVATITLKMENGEMVEVADSEDDVIDGETDITDTKLASLPSTGGIGTTIFTIGGCLIMIVAAGLFFATRRKAEK